MKNKIPLVSVVMPAYNAEKYISQAIESILNQTFKDFEFIIIDDGSSDRTWEIIQEYAKKDEKIMPVKNERNLKMTKTLNKGVHLAKGKYLVRMDADDWSYPYRIQEQVDFMEKNSKVVVSGGSIQVCNERLDVKNKRWYPNSDEGIRKKIFRYNPFAHPSIILRKDRVIEVGMYDENLPLTQDYDLYFRLGKVGKFANLDKILIKLRTHPQSSSMSKEKEQERIAIRTRFKASKEYGYEMTLVDNVYSVIQWLSIYIVPGEVKFWLFNLLRRDS
jgi:glycosyltransferase involved in cell wall biosynthesis